MPRTSLVPLQGCESTVAPFQFLQPVGKAVVMLLLLEVTHNLGLLLSTTMTAGDDGKLGTIYRDIFYSIFSSRI